METAPSKLTSVLALVVSFLLVFVAATAGAMATAQAGSFYTELVRPGWAPPGWLFGPVWTILYACMAVAAWLVWRERNHPNRRTALGIYGIQLILNALWSWIFFAWLLGGVAFAACLLLALLILLTLVRFYPINRGAAWLLVPYLVWVSFATVLTWNLWRNNPDIL